MISKTAGGPTVIRKNILSRIGAYLLLIPFIPAVRPILTTHNTAELIVFSSGFILTLILIIYSNSQPYIRINDRNLYIYLLYRHKPEIHKLDSVDRIDRKSLGILTIHTEGYEPLDLRLSRKNMDKFSKTMEKEGITISKVYRNS